MAMWNPWRGCKKCSDGCLHCYIHKGDFKRNVNTNEIVKTKDYEKPIEKLKNGKYKMKSGIVYTCFSTDFLIEEADEWRDDCWKMIKARVLDIREQCIRKNVKFEFRQCGTYTIKDGKQYKIQTKDLCKQARLANIDYKSNSIKK